MKKIINNIEDFIDKNSILIIGVFLIVGTAAFIKYLIF